MKFTVTEVKFTNKTELEVEVNFDNQTLKVLNPSMLDVDSEFEV